MDKFTDQAKSLKDFILINVDHGKILRFWE